MTEPKDVTSDLFDKKHKCSVCDMEFSSKRVKSSAIRVAKRHEDYYTEYKGANPTYYMVLVCPYCGYSGFEKGYDKINDENRMTIYKQVSVNWVSKDFGGVRTVHDAIAAYKLALLCHKLIGSPKSVIGRLCLRLMWFYREIGDPKEVEFMKFAATSFEEAYLNENMADDLDNELTILYLLGELNRMMGDYEKAVYWFGLTVNHEKIKKKRHIEARARDQWSLAREQFNQMKLAMKDPAS